ncbi:MAG: cupin domain-containing protein [Nitrospirota bacterium]
MPTIFHGQDLTFKKKESRVPEFQWHMSPRLGKLVNSKHLEFYVVSLDPGTFSFPYHFHRAAEELFLVIAGEATLRTPEGFQKVVQGDVIFFEEGPSGAHQLYNHAETPCVYLDLRTTVGIDVCEYPDSGKVNILPFLEVFESSSKVDYYKGEEEVTAKWPKEIMKKRPASQKRKK